MLMGMGTKAGLQLLCFVDYVNYNYCTRTCTFARTSALNIMHRLCSCRILDEDNTAYLLC